MIVTSAEANKELRRCNEELNKSRPQSPIFRYGVKGDTGVTSVQNILLEL